MRAGVFAVSPVRVNLLYRHHMFMGEASLRGLFRGIYGAIGLLLGRRSSKHAPP